MCIRGRGVINAGWWPALTGNWSFKENNYKFLFQHEEGLTGYPVMPDRDSFNVSCFRPRTPKGITDLLLLSFVQLSAACSSKGVWRFKFRYKPQMIIKDSNERVKQQSHSEWNGRALQCEHAIKYKRTNLVVQAFGMWPNEVIARIRMNENTGSVTRGGTHAWQSVDNVKLSWQRHPDI